MHDSQIQLPYLPAHYRHWIFYHCNTYPIRFDFLQHYTHKRIHVSLQRHWYHLELPIWIPHHIKTPTSIPSQMQYWCFQVFRLHMFCHSPWWKWRAFHIIRLYDSLIWLTHDCWNSRRIWIGYKWKSGVPKQNIQKYGAGTTHQLWLRQKIIVLLISIQCLAGPPSFQLSHRHCAHKPMVEIKIKNKFWEIIIWVWKVYVVNSKYGRKSLEHRTSTNPHKVFDPLITDNIPHQAGGFLMGY